MTFHIEVAAMHPNSPWTRERISVLTELWREGLSCSQIAYILGLGFSRNSVIGKVHRLKLHETYPRASWKATRRIFQPRSPRKPRAPAARKVRLNVPPEFPAVPPRAEAWKALPDTKPITLMELNENTCRWPVGDVSPFLYCGCEPADGSSYCAAHRALGTQAVTPASARQKSRDGGFRRLPPKVVHRFSPGVAGTVGQPDLQDVPA